MRQSNFFRIVIDFVRSPTAVFAFVCLMGIVFIAVFAPLLSPQNPYDLGQLNIVDSKKPPGAIGVEGNTYWLGTDAQGRDMLSGIFYGFRISLGIGASSAFIALVIGGSVGLWAAYFGGIFDRIMMRIVDMQLSMPTVLVALVIVAVLGKGVDKIILALVIVQWAYYARTVRGSALAEKEREYVEAAACLSLSNFRIMFSEILPNCLAPLIVVVTIQTAHAIALEASLSFLGVGLPINEPSLGLLIANGFRHLLNGRYWISMYPGFALLIIIFSINLVADRLRDVLNPRLER
jgi:peptide/nickel transport system permease protein